MIKYLLLTIILLMSSISYGQNDRLREIRNTLDQLSENELQGLQEEVNFDLSAASLQEVLRSLAKSHQLNINIGNVPNVTVSNSFNGVVAKDLIYFLCEEYNLNIRFVNTIMSFTKVPDKGVVVKPKKVVLNYENGLVTANLKNDSVYSFSRQFAELTKVNISIGPGLEQIQLNGFIKNLPVEEALRQIAFSNDLIINKQSDNIYTFEAKKLPEANVPVTSNNQNQRRNSSQRSSNQGQKNAPAVRENATGKFKIDLLNKDEQTFSLDADGTDIDQLVVAVSDKLGIDYIMLSPPEGYFDGFLRDVTYEEFLGLILPTANSGYAIKNGVVLIGTQDDSNTMVADVYRIQNRSIDSLEVLIPEKLREEVTLQPYNGLNALIISGDKIAVQRTIDFLKKIDQSIPNVLIEIIVADVRKGYSIKTGITAGLADSTISTGGTVFPGVDLTLSSNSINKFLSAIDSKGLINLGRVTPQFYATVQAMEDNNYMNTRSTPQLSTLNGQKASLKIGQKVFYLIENQNITPGVNPIVSNLQQYEEAEANLEIEIEPFVSGNEDITLNISAEFSDFIEASVEGGPPGTATRQFKSTIRVKNEEMIVLGGLEENRSAESGSGTPLLSRIPVLKWLFSAKSKSKNESRLMIFIKPTVIY